MKEKLKNFFKSKILFLILGLFIGGITSAYAVTYFPSNQVTYDNSSSGLAAKEVQGAIDELYGKIQDCTQNQNIPIALGSNANFVYFSNSNGIYRMRSDGSNLEQIYRL